MIATILVSFQQVLYKLYNNVLNLRHNSKRMAGTIRGFRTFKFAQKDRLLAAFFELFLWGKV